MARRKNIINVQSLFLKYQAEVPVADRIPRKEWYAIYKMYTEFVYNKVIAGYTVILPEKLGRIKAYGKKDKMHIRENGQVNLPIDWLKTKKFWAEKPEFIGKKFIYYLNEHTDGIVFRYALIFYSGKDRINLYRFKAVRSKCKRLHTEVMKDSHNLKVYKHEDN